MWTNSHSRLRINERDIPFPLIEKTIKDPDMIFEEENNKRLYKKLINGKELNVVIRGKKMLVTTYWKNQNGER